MNRDELIKAVTIAQELLTRQARANFKSFVLYSQDDYDMEWFHSCICDKLTAFERGEIKKMMILLPPQHGKECAHSTPVLTTKGFKKHGDLIVGDYVFGRDGK